MKEGDNWECPYCGRAQIVSDTRLHSGWSRLWVQGCNLGNLAEYTEALACANSACRKLTLQYSLGKRTGKDDDLTVGEIYQTWKLLPGSSAKPQPDYIPQPIRGDYTEACAIRDLSPKASATLIRRCLQGMIRDFCSISGRRLVDEIKTLRDRVSNGDAPPGVMHDHVEAIDHVRSIGNIGAHMERDIDVIVDVDPGEAQALIGLVELLFVEWYVARQARMDRLAQIGFIAADKKQIQEQKKLPRPGPAI